jgi:hypothetical protein
VYAGESMPMANGNSNTPDIHLPDWMTKEWVYKLYIEECEESCSKGEDFVFLLFWGVITGNDTIFSAIGIRNPDLYGRKYSFITSNDNENR